MRCLVNSIPIGSWSGVGNLREWKKFRSIVISLPLALTAMRALLASVVIYLALLQPSRLAFGACLTVAFLSDVFDGILARRLNVATPSLRRLDSMADTIFYLCAVFAAWRLHPSAITERLASLLVLGGLEVIRYVFDFAKFGREASYHMWSSKLWGVALFAGFFTLLGLGMSGVPVSMAIYVGILADLEGLAISIVLREWKTDVPTIFHAFRLRPNVSE
jgi:CDP-diacylglycerol--glycerol-3-phosphate 3-phosphatidyltransferase